MKKIMLFLLVGLLVSTIGFGLKAQIIVPQATLKVEWIGTVTAAGKNKWGDWIVGWQEGTQIGLREDGVVVWRKP